MVNYFVARIRYPISGILPAFISHCGLRETISVMEGEKKLLTGLRSLDPEVITKIHETYFPSVYRYAYYRVGDETIAEDLTSEVFIRMLESVQAGRGPNTSLRGWLMGTISNLVNDYYRQVYNNSSEPLSENLLGQNSDPEVLLEKIRP